MSDQGDGLATRPARTRAANVLTETLRTAEQRGLRGQPLEALADLGELRSALGTATPQALRAVAQTAALLALWGGNPAVAWLLCDTALAATDDAATRGRILLCRARITAGPERREAYTAALTEFSVAGDAGGQALALAGLAYPRADDADGIAAYHLRLARDALRLAVASGDAHAIAVCLGNLAAGETYLGRTSTIRRWQRAAERMPADLDTYTAEAMSLNYANWALVAAGHGEYAVARRAVVEGRALARGVAWARTFTAIEALVAWRTGSVDAALAAADRVLAGRGCDQTRERGTAMATVITVAVAFERERRPAVITLAGPVRELSRESDQLGAIALAVQGRIRAARREPEPHRGLVPALAATAHRRRRFGWEDLAMALAEVDPARASTALPALAALWPRGPRGAAASHYVTGLLAGPAGHPDLVAAAEAFLALPEPLSAAAALGRAAGVAPTVGTGNRLRAQALDLYAAAGADRSAAAVLRERRLRRTMGGPRVPASQRNLVHAGLTPREHDVAALVRGGLTAQEISERLSLSIGTVRNHIARIREKFGGISKRHLTDLLAREP